MKEMFKVVWLGLLGTVIFMTWFLAGYRAGRHDERFHVYYPKESMMSGLDVHQLEKLRNGKNNTAFGFESLKKQGNQ